MIGDKKVNWDVYTRPVAAATATTANKFHHFASPSPTTTGFFGCEGDLWRSVYLAAVLEYLAAEVNFTCGGFSTMAITRRWKALELGR
ncbi:hypothetical protein Syun_014592 [Stephania yunnanensis]|uniref:Uncharacterized protein n=1 Tax=Stephania yunnanensis TaxID=152371 RepID=A0AAP0P8Y5_9MAGN